MDRAEHPIRRARVVGTSGAGKTTLARELARRLGVPHIELDAVFWEAGWVRRDRDEANALLRSLLAGPGAAAGWVLCGNWRSASDGLLGDCDAIVWLDYPRRVVMTRLVRRTFRRLITREELWHGNRERASNLLSRDPDRNILVWSWTQHARIRADWAAVERAGAVRVVRLRSPRAARRWLDSVE